MRSGTATKQSEDATALRSAQVAVRAALVGAFFVAAFSAAAFAAVGRAGGKQLESGGTNQGGGSPKSETRRVQAAVGDAVGGAQLSSARFRFFPGSLGGAASARAAVPVNELTIPAVYAKTQPAGEAIAARSWQRDRDPIFYWDAPTTGPEVAGYSYAVDSTPDNTVDTIGRTFDVATSSLRQLSDGKHVFSVKAVNTAGNGGPPNSFEIWIDTTPPTITAASPAAGTMLRTLTASVSATLTDAASGVDPSSIQLLVNGNATVIAFDPRTGTLSATPTSWIQGTNRIELRCSDHSANAQSPLLWSVIMDTIPPSGSVVINAGAAVTGSVYVTLNLNASDLTSAVTAMRISNERAANYVEEPYVPLRSLWRLNAIRGTQTVYVRFVDGAGNVSEPVYDSIELALVSPETLITGGPSGFTASDRATFTYLCPEGGCVFSYAVDHGAWSDWSEATQMTTQTLSPGNHYFRVKAAKETNGVAGIQSDEEDPSPAERTWVVGAEPSVIAMPKGPAVKLWRIE